MAHYRIIKFLYSMHQENIERTPMNNQYVQTHFNQSCGSGQQGEHNYVPFLIKSNRFTPHFNGTGAPPIGTYNLPSCFDRKKSPFEDRISHFILQSHKKNEQMCIFKSSLNRFQKTHNHSPGPASYNLFNEGQNCKKRQAKQSRDKESIIELSRTCPSIPYKVNKYGYSIVEGQLKNIQKSEEQLSIQKQSRKNYVDTLEGQSRIFNREFIQNYHNADQKRRLYEQTSKIVTIQQKTADQSRSQIFLKRPKYQHLYHSKPIPNSNSHKFLGPGQYDINRSFNNPNKKQKFQFFGSTEVRFRDKTETNDKGYSLLQMIKDNRNLDEFGKEKKSPFKKKHSPSQTLKAELKKSPGPGQYNPRDQLAKKSRRMVFFPVQQRFKENAGAEIVIVDSQTHEQLSKSRLKKSYNAISLKKDRFKPMHQKYQPVKSQQICGILSETNEGGNKQKKSTKTLGKLLKLNSRRDGDNLQLKSWSREDTKRKKGGYIRYLKQELAFITYSPYPQQSKKNTKKNDKKENQ